MLSALEGKCWAGVRPYSSCWTSKFTARFLVAIPLLIGAELAVHRRMRFVVKQFLERNLIPEKAMTRFDAAIASVFRLRNSVLAEVLLFAFVYVFGVPILASLHNNRHGHMVCDTVRRGLEVLAAGMWYRLSELTDLPVPTVRWYFRMFIWARFLWQVSRIDLSLVPTHPDRVGGLGFLSETVMASSRC